MSSRPNKSVIVVGAGLAGLMAAHAAAQRGRKVTLMASGAGCLSINGGCIDLLGYTRSPDTGKHKPIEGLTLLQLPRLPQNHPYHIVGENNVEAALDEMVSLCAEHGHMLIPPDGSQSNHIMPTIMGTLKPTYLCSASSNPTPFFQAARVLVVGVGGIRDCHPGLIVEQLQRYPRLANKEYHTAMLPSPLGKTHRSLSALDVARHMDTPEGLRWCIEHLKPLAQGMNAILLPPICGVSLRPGKDSVWKQLQDAVACPVVEMISLPPAVGGLRLRAVFLRALRDAGVRILENTEVVRAEVEQGICTALISKAEDKERRHMADAFIIATGGILGGGITTSPGKAREAIFGLEIDVPENPEAWSHAELFGPHAFASLGVRVNSRLAPLGNDDAEVLHNVHFAGRSLGGYDYVFEKSGNGVALSTGWFAAQMV